jgi:CHAT domain-containing protein
MVNKQLIAEKKSNRHILAIAPVYDNPPPPGSGVRLRQRYRDNLYPLPGALEEARQINRLLKGTLLTDTLATEEAFIKIAPDYGILHLAMHTLIDNRNPLYSKLIFTRTGSEANDGLLNTYELYNLNLNARMVVLSACRSGDGILSKGEGIMSLTRGFLYAGCPSVIMTLWNVEDKTGLNIMIQFYRQLCKGKTKNDALRSAKLDYLKEAAPHKIHPYYWAGYLQIGDETAVFVPLRYGLLAAGPAIVLAWIVFWLFRRRKGHGINLPADNERPDQI